MYLIKFICFGIGIFMLVKPFHPILVLAIFGFLYDVMTDEKHVKL